MLGYELPNVTLRDMVCDNCGGDLAVARDAGTDVRCTGKSPQPPCGRVYRRQSWPSLLDSPLLGTDAAVTLLCANPADPAERERVRNRIKAWHKRGRISNKGSDSKGQALWSTAELEECQRALDLRGSKLVP
jgi:hypothetical protein